MMVETILESSQDFGMSGGALPQWKRELLQRRAARSRPAPPAPPAAPPAPPDDDEELRYGPGIVKRLKSRYLSLALRDAPRRRPSVLRRATSLEHLLDERPPPAPRAAARAPRPASLAAPAHAAQPRREFAKRARSVDALSRLESRDELPPSPPPQPPPQPPQQPPQPPQLPPAPPQLPPAPRPAARPPRRPTPLLRDTERPPPDLVRSTLRKFEPAPVRRAAPAARVSAALRGLERGATPTPEPRVRTPSPVGPASPPATPDEPEAGAASSPRVVSRAALEGIARAGSTTRYAFESPRPGSHLPPLAATNPVLLGRARRVGIIRPMPAPPLERALSAPVPALEEIVDKPGSRVAEDAPRPATPPRASPEPSSPRVDRRQEPPSALVEPIPRSPPDEPPPALRSPPPPARENSPVPAIAKPESKVESKSESKLETKPKSLVNGHGDPPRISDIKAKETVSRVGGAEVEKVWNGVTLKKTPAEEARGAAARRARPAASTSVVFNFSHRKEVPDYIENDGLILRASRRDRIKAGEPGVVVLRPEAGGGGSDSEGECVDAGPPSPCDVRFVNDNVLINGRSSMPATRDRDRQARLKLQFDDSLTRTFEYPSETSLCEPAEPAPAAALLAANTHIASAALGRYTPSKTCADAFQLGVTRQAPAAAAAEGAAPAADEAEGDARPCGADAARSWSEARSLHTDLLF
ncbi:serine/arginine repetitive matrix protein 1-like isoform X2 [Pectinophora gossypiella]|uniref:serine/arginine repetitive matrix protein 1-like isoform X2 n=1 Tax=Pectinophora gossypiella TaxID=13191 RepID=UPI00214DF85E|nr:serine/arginine repetitive matrix protein 1-like isoform X2 [Pectinophora gossypiella]